jgi:hypothetical protein
MNKTLYIYNIDEIPEAQKETFSLINASIEKAIESPGEIIRHSPGWYYVVLADQLIEIDHIDEGDFNGWWIGRHVTLYGVDWYTNPMPTLKALKSELRIAS